MKNKKVIIVGGTAEKEYQSQLEIAKILAKQQNIDIVIAKKSEITPQVTSQNLPFKLEKFIDKTPVLALSPLEKKEKKQPNRKQKRKKKNKRTHNKKWKK